MQYERNVKKITNYRKVKRKDFKLYHITSFEFLPSIRKYGLGAKDPIKDNSLLKILKHLYELCELKISTDPKVSSYRTVTQIMLNQSNETVQNPFTSSSTTPNFLHGDLYLSASEDRAICFALYTAFGSEILTRVLIYICILQHYGIECKLEGFDCSIDLVGLSQTKPKLALIKFNYFEGLRLEIEESDRKSGLEKKYQDINLFNENIEDKIFAAQLQFKTSEIVPASKLKFYELRLYNVPNEQVDYALIRM